VNVFDESRERWEIYFITPDNFFLKMLQTPGDGPIPPAKPFNCPDEGHRALASFVTISDPAKATKVWIGFSDVFWTDAVRKSNEDPAYRKRHMTEIDVKAALKRNQTPHRSIKQIDALIAEYAMPPALAKATLDWSPFKFISRHGSADRMKQECENLRPETALIVTLSDPVGIAQELAFLMRRNVKLFTEKNIVNNRYLTASSAIDQIEEIVRRRALDAEIQASEQSANQQIEEDRIGHIFSSSTRSKTEQIRRVTPSQVKRAQDDAWAKYDKKFDNPGRQKWNADYGKRLEAFDAEFIAPLALNHVAWMKSTALLQHLECNYDPHHAESGEVYTMVVTRCLTATQDKKACAQLYNEWLQGDITDKKNFLLRAMVLNQNITADSIKAAAEVTFDIRQIPWDNIFAASSSALGKLAEKVQDITAHLIAQVGGPLAQMFHKIIDGSRNFRAAIMATGLISGHPVVVCEITGSRPQFVKLLTRQLMQISGHAFNEVQLRYAVAAELKRQEIHGKPVSGTAHRQWLMTVDKEMTNIMPDGLTPQNQREWLVKHIRTPEAVESLNLERWRRVINTHVRVGVLTGILQAVCLTKLISDQQKSLGNENFDASARLYAGMTAVGATTSEVIGIALSERATLGMRYGQGLASTMGDFLKRMGKNFGLGAGLVVAGLDFYKGFSEFREGADGLVVVSYLGSGIVGIALSAALLASASIPVIGFLILLAIGIGILIENIKDNPLQDWLERCPWGRLKDQRYVDAESEQAQLNLALKEG
jgi:hypothetical protein